MTPVLRFTCVGCGRDVPGVDDGALPFRCPWARPGDDIDHVVVDTHEAGAWDAPDEDPNPFVRYRRRLSWWRVGADHGLTDGELIDVARRFDEAVARVDGRGFLVTPFRRCPRLSDDFGAGPGGGVWVKDETGNVSGSHKGRHLAGVLLFLMVVQHLRERGLLPTPAGRDLADRVSRSTFAIASCGNAALAAGVLARAAALRLRVFVPSSAVPNVVESLRDLGAEVVVCPRRDDERGDPAYLRFREAIADGAVPFCVQGPDNGLTVEGGATLAWEMCDALGATTLDRVLVQVGGGAIASATIRGLQSALAERRAPLPRVHAIQTAGAFPLARAYARVVERLGEGPLGRAPDADPDAVAAWYAGSARRDHVATAMRQARRQRSSFMWPWETEPRSLAHGILDDESYDWAVVVEGMLTSGGWPVVVTEQALEEALDLVRRRTGIDTDHTGASGVAGLLTLMRMVGDRPFGDERVAVIVSGRRRG